MSTVVNSNFKHIKRTAIALLLTQPFMTSGAAFAQSIVPTNDLGTQVNSATTNPQQLNITGGTQVDANLYHSFQQFGLNQGQIANFLSNPSIQNILGRVVGGSPSVINGLIQVTGGSSNLYLLNPAGIIFGSNASLNVPASFTATTANGIQVGNGWFGINTSVDAIKNLSGNPQAFGFAANPSSAISSQGAPIINAGNLSVNQGQNITLVGGLVINTGTIATPSGKITIAAVPNGKYVKITPEGSLLSLELPIAAQQELAQRSILGSDLPKLLTGSSKLRDITGLNVNSSGNVLVANSPIPSTAGTAIASGNLDVSSTNAKGGEINVLGDRVGLVSANLNASGAIGGGTVLIGGDFQGKGIVPNAQYTFVSKDSTIRADALTNGSGGKVIVWANSNTNFLGNISAKGGLISGDGGFVEVSGKQHLGFSGNINTFASQGSNGTLLLDPDNITIEGLSSNPAAVDTTLTNTGKILFSDFSNQDITVDQSKLNNLTFTNIILQANQDITLNGGVAFNNPVTTFSLVAGRDILFIAGTPFINGAANLIIKANRNININNDFSTDAINTSFIANAANIGTGSFVMTNATKNLSTQNLSIAGVDITLGNVNAGNMNLSASNNISVLGNVNAGNMNLSASNNISVLGTLTAFDSAVNLTATNNIFVAPLPNGFFNRAISAASVSMTSTNGNISTGSISTILSTNAGNENVILNAPNGNITLDGFIKAGSPDNTAADNTITITAQRFTAINPLSDNANYVNVGDTTGFINNGQQNPTSLIAYAAFTTDPVGTFTGAPVRSVQLQLPGDTSPRTIAGSGAPIISINILKDTTFSIYPRAIASGTSGTSGAISQGVSSIPPNVFVLIFDQSFSSNTNTSTNSSLANALTANTLSNDAIASARTADLQANVGEVKDCEPTGTKKPILNLTASVPSVTVTRTAQKPNRSNLPPCKE